MRFELAEMSSMRLGNNVANIHLLVRSVDAISPNNVSIIRW